MSRAKLEQLWQLLKLELEGYSQLHQMLLQQGRLLIGQDHQGLLVHNPRQLQLSRRLNELGERREVLSRELSGTHGGAAIERLCRQLPDKPARELSRQWQELLATAGHCKQLNDGNGRLLASQKEWLERHLELSAPTYAPD
ncbi:flagellar protein FlgN [Zobellella iuensis]|uniref:Flagellar export chaperone FlgN n=1 Tax=Zobellella iuensis TaxID=2803811 RepID=A0ABS1QVH7_9GAMM|nr:flagellar protein FlgN [Zobellella iuensis]MBL1378860.1 flagellar export chaperone FlgN [Zobellella iuensis]